jgi:hypothetical protein
LLVVASESELAGGAVTQQFPRLTSWPKYMLKQELRCGIPTSKWAELGDIGHRMSFKGGVV